MGRYAKTIFYFLGFFFMSFFLLSDRGDPFSKCTGKFAGPRCNLVGTEKVCRYHVNCTSLTRKNTSRQQRPSAYVGCTENTRQLLHLCRDSKDSQCKLTLENIFHMNTSLCCRFLKMNCQNRDYFLNFFFM